MNHIRFSPKLGLAFVLLALLCTCGCQTKSAIGPTEAVEDERIPPGEKLISAPDSRLADVPVPLAARFKANSSSSYETGGGRTVKYCYGIWAKPILVRTFYEDNMPIHSWQLLHSISNKSSQALSFRKAGESCNITIGPSNWCFQTLIRIEIQPIDGSY